MIPKFRAWDPHEKKMVDDTELVIWGGNIYQGNRQKIFERIVEGKKGLIGYSIDDKYLMQSTGLKDKNGVEIFEGDVVTRNGGFPSVVKFGSWVYEEDFGAKARNVGFYIDSSYTDEEWLQSIDYEDISKNYEIVGNIYENPELMEADNDPK